MNKKLIRLTESDLHKIVKESVGKIINEIGDTPKGQEMLGRTAERAYQRAQRTSGADKKRYMRTYDDAYKTGGKSSNKHLGGSREHFDNGRDYEYEKWADEHNGNVAESKTMNKKLIRLTESDLHKIVKESVNKIINEIGDTEKGQDALGQVRGRADKRSKLLGGAMGNKYRKISHDAQEKAYSQGEKHGFDIYDPNGAYDKGISKGYEKALAKEPRLHKIVKESVNRILRESNRKEVFTISAFNIENEEDVSDMRYCGQTYYNIDDAIASATEFAQSLIDYGSVVMVTVYAGEYQTESGDIFGEPQDVYTISNSDRRTTAIARKKAGYVTDKVNDYAI
jgi:hypothetical protein